MKFASLIAATALALTAGSASALTVTASTDATALATALAGQGVTISNATFTSLAGNTAAGTFSGAAGAIGFDKGVILTTGSVDCAPGPNTQTNCGGGGSTTSLQFDFTSTTGNLFFKYVFASEEYNEYVGTKFNDLFELRINGQNIALLPGNAGVVSINNVNLQTNSAYYRNNSNNDAGAPSLNLDTQYDGLTTVLTAFAEGLSGTNHFEFLITDQGDSDFDSAALIQAGTFSANDVPEPGSLALLGLGLTGLVLRKRNKA